MAFHPDLRASARWLPRGVGTSWVVRLSRLIPAMSAPLPRGVTVEQRRLDDHSAIRIIRAKAEVAPVLLWIHGGGYVIGAAKTDDVLCARFALRLGVTVVSVDYRLAPEHPFPAALDDCVRAYELVQREGAALGLDPSRVIIGGASAGGGLAATLALRVHDRKLPPPLLQLLVYPMLDDRTVLRVVDDRHHRLWNPASNRFGWTQYLGTTPGGPDVSDHAAAARRVDLSGLPPAWIGVGTHDLFHDEDVDYARRLREAGVPTELEIVEGAFHGFDLVRPKLAVSQRFFAAQCDAIARALTLNATPSTSP